MAGEGSRAHGSLSAESAESAVPQSLAHNAAGGMSRFREKVSFGIVLRSAGSPLPVCGEGSLLPKVSV